MRWARAGGRPSASRAISPPACASRAGPTACTGCMPFELRDASCVSGVSPRDALLAGTRWGAEACRVDRPGRHGGAGQARRPDRGRGRSARATSRAMAGCALVMKDGDIRRTSCRTAMIQRGGTGDERSGADGARGPEHAAGVAVAHGGLAAGAGLASLGGLARRSRVRAGPAQARRHPEGRHRRQAGQHGPGLRPALLVAAGLPERLQQAGLRGRGRPVRPRAREVLEAGRATRPGSSTSSTTPSSTTASRSPPRTWPSRSTACSTPRTSCPMRVFFSPVEGVEAVGPHQVRFT